MRTYVGRRQDLVLKRLRTGQVGDVGILAAVAAPSIVVTVIQVVVGTAVLLAIGVDLSTSDPLLPLVGLLLGTVAFVVLAAASTTFTKTAETAQIATMPTIMISTALSGMFFPLTVLPYVVADNNTYQQLRRGAGQWRAFGSGGWDTATRAV